MRDFILLMHDDTVSTPADDAWPAYLSALRDRGAFDGGSSIGIGETFRKAGMAGAASAHLTGYIRVRAETLESARRLLAGNPVFECGGTVEIRELPRE